jgi:DNA-binding transcriptional MerR regulator
MRKMLLTASQAGALAGVSADTVRLHTRRGTLKPAASAQGVSLYDPRAIKVWAKGVRPRGRKAA